MGEFFQICNNFEENINYRGNNLNNAEDKQTKELCAEFCAKTPRCAAWTYDPRNGKQHCWLKTSGANKATLDGVWSGECEGEI